jgi:hypothetical protein
MPSSAINRNRKPLLDRHPQVMPAARTHVQVAFDLLAEGYLFTTRAFDPNIFA